MEKPMVMTDVSLCAIVRDEMINPAGGIEDFVCTTVPFVANAVIVDTGSKDGTLEKLYELQKYHPNMTILQNQFTDFASMRNFALKHVTTAFALVLDADERLFHEDFKTLESYVRLLKKEKNKLGIDFVFWSVYTTEDEDSESTHGGQNPRLFRVLPELFFKNDTGLAGEYLYFNDKGHFVKCHCERHCITSGIKIKHFCPSKAFRWSKWCNWYRDHVQAGIADRIAPSEVPGFMSWKALNPRRFKV